MNRITISRICLAATVSTLLLSGCAGPTAKELVGTAIGRPYTTTAEDRAKLEVNPNFKLLPPANGRSAIYIYRNSQFYAGGRDYQLFIDGRLSGEVANGRYVRLEVEPGEYTLHAQLPQYVPETPPAADDLNQIQPTPKAFKRGRLDTNELSIVRLNLGQKHVGTIYGSKGNNADALSSTFNLQVVSTEEGVFDMSRLKSSEK